MHYRIQEEREERHKYKGVVKSTVGGSSIYETEDSSNKSEYNPPLDLGSVFSCFFKFLFWLGDKLNTQIYNNLLLFVCSWIV